ncbi:MAG: hypothetical protein ABR999_10650 [Methanoregula sp.]|jgi:hypothetical protein
MEVGIIEKVFHRAGQYLSLIALQMQRNGIAKAVSVLRYAKLICTGP